MENQFTSHLISPATVLKGKEAWGKGQNLIPLLSKKPLLLGRSSCTFNLRKRIKYNLENHDLEVNSIELDYGCCELDLKRIEYLSKSYSNDAIIAAGGGKVLDAGKLLASRLQIPCITIPLSGSTCAGWTALSNIYSPEGCFLKDISLAKCPDLLIFDHKFIQEAPSKTLASGIADALAKWYESSISCGSSHDVMVQQAVQLARVLRDQLLIDGYKSYQDKTSIEWDRTIEGCALSAGLIGGIGGSRCRTAAAHALHNGLTQLKSTKNPLHGEIVGFGILVQLKLEEMFSNNQLAKQARKQLQVFMQKLNLPLTLGDLGFSEISIEELEKACIFACKNNLGMENLPFKVTSKTLLNAVIDTSNEESIRKDNSKKSIIGKIN